MADQLQLKDLMKLPAWKMTTSELVRVTEYLEVKLQAGWVTPYHQRAWNAKLSEIFAEQQSRRDSAERRRRA